MAGHLLTVIPDSTLAPLSSVARLAYQIPMADGTDKTVIYMIVVLLALAEQVIAIIAGCAPVVSGWFIRRVMHKGQAGREPASPGGGNVPRTITERFRPDREGPEETPRERRLRKWGRGKASDPYPTLTTGQSTASEEALDPRVGTPGDAESERRSETWELSDVEAARSDPEARIR